MSTSDTRAVDVLIIGAGPTGLFGAYYAGFRGLSVAVVKEGKVVVSGPPTDEARKNIPEAFKRRFGGNSLGVPVLKQVYMRDQFMALCRQGDTQERGIDYFPPYRSS